MQFFQTQLSTAISWLQANPLIIGLITAMSVLLLLCTVVVVPWLIARLPTDYLVTQCREPDTDIRRSAGQWCVMLLRATAGVIVLLLGIIMLVVPGPGFLVMLLGLTLIDFPGKHHLVMRLARLPNVFGSLNWIRRRVGRPPFEQPD